MFSMISNFSSGGKRFGTSPEYKMLFMSWKLKWNSSFLTHALLSNTHTYTLFYLYRLPQRIDHLPSSAYHKETTHFGWWSRRSFSTRPSSSLSILESHHPCLSTMLSKFEQLTLSQWNMCSRSIKAATKISSSKHRKYYIRSLRKYISHGYHDMYIV